MGGRGEGREGEGGEAGGGGGGGAGVDDGFGGGVLGEVEGEGGEEGEVSGEMWPVCGFGFGGPELVGVVWAASWETMELVWGIWG